MSRFMLAPLSFNRYRPTGIYLRANVRERKKRCDCACSGASSGSAPIAAIAIVENAASGGSEAVHAMPGIPASLPADITFPGVFDAQVRP